MKNKRILPYSSALNVMKVLGKTVARSAMFTDWQVKGHSRRLLLKQLWDMKKLVTNRCPISDVYWLAGQKP